MTVLLVPASKTLHAHRLVKHVGLVCCSRLLLGSQSCLVCGQSITTSYHGIPYTVLPQVLRDKHISPKLFNLRRSLIRRAIVAIWYQSLIISISFLLLTLTNFLQRNSTFVLLALFTVVLTGPKLTFKSWLEWNSPKSCYLVSMSSYSSNSILSDRLSQPSALVCSTSKSLRIKK